ncbi:5312_t:CDS:1 [Funneliformis mosseae]|uniref:5312_t:CDS:1 n=1 Tax=Funneliformis mosseae TaxID=27381 RepID=A0A9N9FUV2_FUNMO|nr:5312_t:CDS:1 [Funneliformis mosseae]
MSSTQDTNLGLSESQVGLCTEETTEKTNDITTTKVDQEVANNSSEEKPKDKDVETLLTEEEKEQHEEIADEQQNNVESDPALKELNQEELNKVDSTNLNVNAIETEKVSEENGDQATLSGWSAVWDDNAQAYYYWNTITNETTWETPSNISNNNDLTAQPSNSEYAEYSEQDYYQYYSQYGYYPEAYYYGYDGSTLTASSGMANTAVASTEPPINPLDTLLDKIDKEVKSKLDRKPSKSKSSPTSESPYNSNDQEQAPSSTNLDKYDQYQSTTNDSDYQSFLAEHGSDGADYKFTARFNARTGKFQRDPTLNPEKFSADAKAIRQMSYFFDYDQFAESRGSAANKRLSSDASLDDSIRSHKKLNKKDIEMFKQKKKEKKEMKKKSWLLSDD